MKPRHKRLALVAAGLAALGGAAALILTAFQSNLVFFYTPTQVATREAPQGRAFRIGGLVETGSVQRQGRRCDGALRGHRHRAERAGALQRHPCRTCSRKVRAWWRRASWAAMACSVPREVLAKHDENYMPPEAAEAVERARTRRCRSRRRRWFDRG